MNFNSLEFLVFFPVLILFYFTVPKRMRNGILLIASLYFYMCWDPRFIVLLGGAILVSYAAGLLIDVCEKSDSPRKQQWKKAVLLGCILLELVTLGYFKYTNFLLNTIETVFSFLRIPLNVPTYSIVLPVGISFFIFQSIGYVIDVYRKDIYAEKNLAQYALFVSFFPQLVAGPIERSKNLLVQLSQPGSFDQENFKRGFLTMLWGFFTKLVIAERCAIVVNTVYTNYTDYHGIQLVIANALFAIQIYCDFMAYSTIAKGAALMLGYHLMDNFRQPYFAVSIKDFWRRWHISLSTWFKDYLYIPLGGSRCSKAKQYRNLFLTFLVSGLWHGAGGNYVVWGGIHGCLQILEDMTQPFFKKVHAFFHTDTTTISWRILCAVKTFLLVDMALVFFRADTVAQGWDILVRSVKLDNAGLLLNGEIFQLGLDQRNVMILLVAIGILFVVSLLKEQGRDIIADLSRQHFLFRYLIYWTLQILIILSLNITGQEFIYFQF